MLAIAGLTFPVASLCLNTGAVLQYTPQPLLWQIVALAPMIIPVVALTGILLAGIGRAVGAGPTEASRGQLPR